MTAADFESCAERKPAKVKLLQINRNDTGRLMEEIVTEIRIQTIIDILTIMI